MYTLHFTTLHYSTLHYSRLHYSVWGSPGGAVGLVLRAINEVKLDRARLVLGWLTRLTVSIGLWLWADQLRP